jgi:hypothetical protein
VELVRPRKDDNDAFMTIAEESKGTQGCFCIDSIRRSGHHVLSQGNERARPRTIQGSHEARSGSTHQELIKKSAVPKGYKIMQSVLSMKRKRKIATQEI